MNVQSTCCIKKSVETLSTFCCHVQLAELREFMQAKAIPRELRIKVRRYMETLYEQKSGFDEQQILRELPPAMAQELLNFMYVTSIHTLLYPGRFVRDSVSHLLFRPETRSPRLCSGFRYHNVIKGVPFFRPLEEAAIIRLCGLLKPFRAMKEDLIYKRGEVGRELYIVMRGEVRISFTDTVAKTLGPGQTFGEGMSYHLTRLIACICLPCVSVCLFLRLSKTLALLFLPYRCYCHPQVAPSTYLYKAILVQAILLWILDRRSVPYSA
jgi:hypothetical protein